MKGITLGTRTLVSFKQEKQCQHKANRGHHVCAPQMQKRTHGHQQKEDTAAHARTHTQQGVAIVPLNNHITRHTCRQQTTPQFTTLHTGNKPQCNEQQKCKRQQPHTLGYPMTKRSISQNLLSFLKRLECFFAFGETVFARFSRWHRIDTHSPKSETASQPKTDGLINTLNSHGFSFTHHATHYLLHARAHRSITNRHRCLCDNISSRS